MANRTLQRLEARLFRIAIERFDARIDDSWILEVAGRRTGMSRYTPVKLLDVDGSRYLVALDERSDWSKNLRAANGVARLRRRGRIQPVAASELPPAERPPILRAYLAAATRAKTLDILGAGRRDPDEAHLNRIAPDHRVFQLAFSSAAEATAEPDRARAVRVVERWGLVAGVTGVAANVLLIALYAVGRRGDGAYAWTGPADDVIGGIVSTSATIPVALALRDLVGGGTVVRRATTLAVGAMAAIAGSSVLLVTDVLPFEVQVFVAMPAAAVMFGWTAVIGRSGAATGSLPPRLARMAVFIGGGACAGLAVAGVSLLLPRGSLGQYVVGGAGLLAVVPAFLAFPGWLIALSNQLPAHVAPTHESPAPITSGRP